MNAGLKKRLVLGGLARVADYIWAQQGSVLCLHSVRKGAIPAESFSPLGHLSVSGGFLELLVCDLRSRGVTLVSLSDALQRLQRGKMAGRFVALTFDDGYADNFAEAFPLLVRLGVPFTVFLTSGFVDGTVPMWWVGLEAILGDQDKLHLPGRTIPARTMAEKMMAFSIAEEVVRGIARKDVASFCERLFKLNSAARSRQLAFSAALDWNQARAMARTGLVNFGCHTVSHPVLSRLDEAQCRSEIIQARDRITDELQAPPEFFAYPYGGLDDIGAFAPGLVARCGFRAAFTTARKLLRAANGQTETYAIPRLVLESEDLVMTRTHISGLPWALRDAGGALLRNTRLHQSEKRLRYGHG